MFVEGKLKSYITDRGFGFIQVEGQSKELFFHINDFPKKSVEPKIGEKLKFRIVEDDGKLKASQIVRLDLKRSAAKAQTYAEPQVQIKQSASPRYNKKSGKGRIFTILGLIVIVVLAVMVYGKYQDYRTAEQLKAQQLIVEQQRIVSEQREALGDLPEAVLSEQGQRNLAGETYNTNKPRSEKISASIDQQNGIKLATTQFKCDERQHCSQMNLRAEAVWYVQNCPNHKMDGDGDGIPCENDPRW